MVATSAGAQKMTSRCHTHRSRPAEVERISSSCKFSIDHHFHIVYIFMTFRYFHIFSPAFSTNLSVFSCLLGPWDSEIYESMEHHGPLWSTDKQISPKLIQKTDPVMWSSSFFLGDIM